MKKQKHQKQQTRRPASHAQTLLAEIYLLLVVTVFVLVPGFSGYEAISGAKYTLFLWLSGGYAALSLLLSLELRLTGQEPWISPKALLTGSTWTQRLLALYLLWTLLATLVSPHRSGAWVGLSRNEGFLTIAIHVCAFLCLSVHGRADRKLLWAFGGAMTLQSVICILQLLGKNPLNLYPGDLTYYDAGIAYSGAYLGTIGNADLTSAVLALAVPVFGTAIWKGQGRSRFLLLIPLLLSLTVLLWCRVAAGYVALLGGLLLTVPALLRQRKARIIGWIVSGCLCVLAAALVYAVPFSGGTLGELHQLLHGQISDTFGSGRIHIWRQVLELAGKNLLFGTGPDTLMAAELEGFTRMDENLQLMIVAQIDLAHNEYLQILVSQGLPALLLYLGALGTTAVRWFRQGRDDRTLAICGSAVLWYCIQVFFGFSLIGAAPLFWAAWALAEHRGTQTE